MRTWIASAVALLLCVFTLAPPARADQGESQERIRDAAQVFNEIMNTPDKGIPQDLLGEAQCVVIIPSMMQGAFVFGAKYGRGVATCRTGSGWSAPSMVLMGGGSFGFQIGGAAIDVVALIMNKHGEEFLYRDKVNLGADATVAAGPVGRRASAETNATMKSEILTWSRSRGLFAGVALNGATLRTDKSANRRLYGDATTRQILAGNVATPPAARPLIAALTREGLAPGTNRPAEPRGLGKPTDHDKDPDRDIDRDRDH